MKTAVVASILLSLVLVPVLLKGEEAKTCPKCRASVKADWNICPMCGEDLRKEEAKNCPQCGHPLEEEWKFCPLCGAARAQAKGVKGAKAPEEKILWDFEKRGQISAWKLKDTMKVKLTPEHATGGKNSVRLDWTKSGGGPSFRYEGQMDDFSAWRYLKFDAFNPGEKIVTLLVKLKSTEHQKKTTLNFTIPPNEEKTVSVRLDGLAGKIDLSEVMYLNFFVWEPQDPGTVFIDTIRLTNE